MEVNRSKKVTLSDVAERAGVSRTTASYILGKTRGGFAKETVERVHTAAKELGFKPNPIAQCLRTGRTSLVGLLTGSDTHSHQDHIRSQINVGIATEARQNNLDLVQVLVSPEAGPEIDRISDLLSTGLVEGLILNATRMRGILPWLREHNAKFVVVGNPKSPCVYSVGVDNIGVGRITARHLIDLGHKNMAYIAPPDDLAYGNDRAEGFLLECIEAGIDRGNCLVVRTEDSLCGGYKAMKEILNAELPVTGVCASDDIMAYGAISAIKETKLSIPEDISVIGSNSDCRAAIDPEFLTTVELDLEKLGSLALRKLIDLLEGKEISRRDMVGFRLIERSSSGPAKSREEESEFSASL